jgi:hypothetical protein
VIEMSSLPNSFKNAIFLTRRLGLRYIWTDSLCIIQDEPKDCEFESAKMATIYEQSFLTTAVSSSPSSDHSFLDERNNTMWEPLTIECPNDSGQLTNVKARFMPRTGIHDFFNRSRDPWDMRAWTPQEKLLSTRLVSHSRDEMQWSCKTLPTSECEAGIGRDWTECPRSPFKLECNNDAYMFWHMQVMDYSQRRLTDPKDKYEGEL